MTLVNAIGIEITKPTVKIDERDKFSLLTVLEPPHSESS